MSSTSACSTYNLLTKWGFSPEIIANFTAQEIEADQLNILTEEDLKSLIPNIRPRRKFQSIVKQYLNEREIQQLHPEENSNTINHEQQSLAAQQEQVENLIKQKNIESNIHNQDIIYYLQSLPETQQSISDNVSVATSELNDVLFENKGNQSGVKRHLADDEYDLEANDVLLENKENQLGVKRHLTDDEYNLEAVLKKSEEGLLVLSSYQKEKRLNNDMRNKLAKLIVSNELSPNINCSITSSRALFLAKKYKNYFLLKKRVSGI
ncbi:uncharacterized protein [Linepithema humile]|uniref:uncharacterized protein isoform X1 n=1 Tax=Linepithema humile TaxID=83485 RepID=UPI00351E1656